MTNVETKQEMMHTLGLSERQFRELIMTLTEKDGVWCVLRCTAHYTPLCAFVFADETEAREWLRLHRVDGGVYNPPPARVIYAETVEDIVSAMQEMIADYRRETCALLQG